MAYLTEPLFDITLHKMICSKGDFSSLYDISHVNGQFVATFKHVSRPMRGTEIYIRKIPVDLLLQEILEFTMKAGDIYQIRLLMEFSGYNRGYCFVSYFDVKSARKAAVILNGEKIRGSSVVVKLSFDNNRLELQNVPKELDPREVYEEISKIIGKGLQKVLKLSPTEENSQTVKCLLRYETHKKAVEARKQVYPCFRMFGKNIEIDWTIPTEIVKAKRLYFENAPMRVTKSELYEDIVKFVDPENILNMFLQRGIGYILFTNEKVAFESFTIIREKKLCGLKLRFSFMKFHSHLLQENNYIKENEDKYEICTDVKEPTPFEDTPTGQEDVSSQDIFSMSHLANSLDDSSATSSNSFGSRSSNNILDINNTLQPTPTSFCAQQPLMVAPPQPALFSDPSTFPSPQFALPDYFLQCGVPMNCVNPVYNTSLVQSPRICQLSAAPMSFIMPNQPIQILNLSPVVNNVPYDLTILQMTEDHYRKNYL